MKVLKIIPVRVDDAGGFGAKGLVDIEYEYKCGWFWSSRKRATRRLFARFGVLWSWLDNPGDNQHEITDMIHGNIPELMAGETVVIQEPSGVLVDK